MVRKALVFTVMVVAALAMSMLPADSLASASPSELGNITIVVNVEGSDGGFSFSGDWPDPDPASTVGAIGIGTDGGSGSVTFTGIPPSGAVPYTLTAVGPAPRYEWTKVRCDDPDGGSSVEGTTALIDLDGGETVTCTYTARQMSTITVIKDAVPDDGQAFTFTTSGVHPEPFILVDDGTGRANAFTSDWIPAGRTYKVAEIRVAGWRLRGATCDNGDWPRAITPDPGADVTCTFVNEVDPDPGKFYYLSNSLRGGVADEAFGYGLADDRVLVGDWDGNGTDTLAVRRGAYYYLSNDFKGGEADEVFKYGLADDEVFVGDWDGDGVDTLAVRRGRTFYVTNRLRGGDAEAVFQYGKLGDVVLVGDWDGDGDDTFAVRRGRTYYIDNDLRGGVADTEFIYGRSGDLVYVGDWDADGNDTLGVRRERTYYLNNALQGGVADNTFMYGLATDITLIGDWDGDGGDTLGVRRTERP